MSNNFWKLLSKLFGLLAVATVFGLAYFAANIEIKDLDLWLHIGTGRYIVEHSFLVPQTDILSCTVTGHAWNNHEWLFQVLVYFLQKIFGFDGIIQMQVVLVMLTLAVLFIIGYNPEKQLSSAFILFLTFMVYQTRFTTRPDLFSLFFFSLYIWILSHFLKKRWSIYALIIVQVLWTNMHGFFFFGPIFVLIGIFAEWIKRRVPLPWEWNKMGRLDDEEYRRLKWVFVLVVLACLLNPQTVRGALYPVKVFFQISGESKIFFDNIVELKKPITRVSLLNLDEYFYYKFLIVLSFLSFYFNRRRIDLGIFLFWLVFLLFSLAAVRNISFFAFAAYLVFATNILTISWKNLLPIRIRDPIFLCVILIALKLCLIYKIVDTGIDISRGCYYDLVKLELKSEFGGVSLRSFPYKAVDFLVAQKVKGNFFNDFNSGAYLVGRCFPNIKVFIDGRTEVYGPKFFKFYKKVYTQADDIEKTLRRYQITGAFLHSTRSPAPAPTLKYFVSAKDWVPVYFDDDAVIFLKDVAQNRAVIARHKIDFAKLPAPQPDLKKIGSKNIPVFPYINRAYSLLDLGFDNQAMDQLMAAKSMNPSNGEVYKLLGKIYAKQANYPKAFENFRLAVLFMPNDDQARENLALAYFDQGEYGYSAEQYLKIIDTWPQNAKAYFRLAQCRIKLKKYDAAGAALNLGFAIDKSAAQEFFDVADLFLASQQYEKARMAYALAKDIKSWQADVHLKIGQVYRKAGEFNKAKMEFEQGLKINATSDDLKRNLDDLKSVLEPVTKKQAVFKI